MKKAITISFLLFVGVKIYAIDTITLNNFASDNYCAGNTLNVSFTTTLPSGSSFTAKLYRDNIEVISTDGLTNEINIALHTGLLTSSHYSIIVSSSGISSEKSADFTINNIGTVLILDEFGNNSSGYVVCTGKAIKLYSKVYDKFGNLITEPILYKWFKNNIEIINSNENTLITSEEGTYTLSIGSGCGPISNNVSVYLRPEINTEFFINQRDITCVGSNMTLTAAYVSTTAVYNWKYNDILIPDSNKRKIDVTGSGMYKINIFDGECTNNNMERRLTFSTGLFIPIIALTGDTTLCGGNSVHLITAISPSENLSESTFQWQKNGLDIVGANQTQYFASTPGVYNMKYTKGSCISHSKNIVVVNSNKAQKPIITAGNIDTICNGTIRITQNLKYDYLNGTNFFLRGRWFKDEVEIFNYNSGEYTAQVSGVYKMVYGNGNCEVESNEVSINIGGNTFSAKIKLNPNFSSTNICGNSFFLLNFDGEQLSNNFTFQWKKNGQNLLGQNSNSIYINSPGTYSLMVGNGTCNSVSNSILITGNQEITINALENEVYCSNRVVKLSIDLPEYFYKNTVEWKKDGVTVPNEHSTFLYTTQHGLYTALVNSPSCTATSQPFQLYAGTPSTFYTLKSGNWNDPLCWICNQTPNNTIDVKISNGHNIIVPTGTHEVKKVIIEGNVNIETGGEIKVHGGN